MNSRGRTKVQRTTVLNWLRKICGWPNTTEMTRADFERLLKTVPPSNTEDLGQHGATRYRERHTHGLLQSMTTNRWNPMDHGPVIIANGPMGLRIENGEHRLRAGSIASMNGPVEMLMKLKEYKTEDEYRQSLQQHDQLVKKRTIMMQADAAGTPIPKLGLQNPGGMVPTIFSGAMCLMAEFGTRQNPWPVTYETWREHVLPVLGEPIKTLTEASQCESAYDHQDRIRIERKLYQMHPTALLLEFCRVDPEKATTFINRLLGGKHALRSDHIRNISDWIRNEAAKAARDQALGAWRHTLPMKLISGWESHCTNLNRPRRVVVKKHVTIHRSSLIWWPGSTVKRSRDTTEAKGTNPGPPESGTTSDGTAQP